MTVNPALAERLDSMMHEAVRRYRLPGLAVVVNHAGHDRFAAGMGRRNATKADGINADTLFGVASLSKLITAIALLRLDARDALSIDAPVARYWPAFRLASQVPMRLVHLLSHSAGLPGLPGRFHARNLADASDRSGGIARQHRPGEAMGEASSAGITTPAELVELIQSLNVELLAPPGRLLNYSNEGFCLLGGVIEAVTGQSYADAIDALVTIPLGLSRTTMGLRGLETLGNVATPLARDGERWRDLGFWDAPLFYPAGGAIASARDLVRLIRVLDDDDLLLAPDSRRRLMQWQMPIASRPGARSGYGLALEHHRLGANDTLLWHSGQRAGISSFVGWLARHRLAIAVLSNVADAPVASIGHDMIAQVLGRDDICWPPPGATASALSGRSAQTARFTGRYQTAEGFDVGISAGAGHLTLATRGRTEPLLFADADSGTVGGQTFRFLPDANGHIRALALDLRILPRDA